jgi:AcrR family transcriptional regulator
VTTPFVKGTERFMTRPRASGEALVATARDDNVARPLRADAQKNRARVLAAAEAVFAARGVTASTEEVAREAGVGIGTVFRHFPTKEALLEAVIVSRLRRFADEAQALAAAKTADPGHSFFTLVWRAVDQSAAKNAVAAALAEVGVDLTPATAPIMAEMRNSLDILLTRAQQAGAVRDDVGVNEVIALLIGAARAAESTSGDQAVMLRTVAIICDGLRPPGTR